MRKNIILKRAVSIALIAIMAVIIVYAGEITVNKAISASYDAISQAERDMLTTLGEYLNAPVSDALPEADAEESVHTVGQSFNMPVLFVQKGFIRGGAYLFNLPITEHSLSLGLNGGVFAAEILVPAENNLVAPYRLALFTPGLSSLIFSPEDTTVSLCGTDTRVICFDEASLEDGSFTAALDALFSQAPGQ